MAIFSGSKQKIQEAADTPFDNTNIPFQSNNTQDAISELRSVDIKTPTVTTTTTSGNLSLNNSSTTLQILSGSAEDFTINLPDATTLFSGTTYKVVNSSDESVSILDKDNSTVFQLQSNSTVVITLEDNSLLAGVWKTLQGPPGPQGPQGPIGNVIYDGGRPETDFSVGFNIDAGGVT